MKNDNRKRGFWDLIGVWRATPVLNNLIIII